MKDFTAVATQIDSIITSFGKFADILETDGTILESFAPYTVYEGTDDSDAFILDDGVIVVIAVTEQSTGGSLITALVLPRFQQELIGDRNPTKFFLDTIMDPNVDHYSDECTEGKPWVYGMYGMSMADDVQAEIDEIVNDYTDRQVH